MACVHRGWRGSARWFDLPGLISDVLECRTNGRGFVTRHAGDFSFDEHEASLLRKIRDASLVCLDDVAVRRPSEAAYEIFLNVLNARVGKPTICTGNLSGKSLLEVYDARLCSRLLCGTVIHVTGHDRRIASAKIVRA